MAGSSKGWTPEKRAAQAEKTRQRKPWLKSTGPKTKEGKDRSRYNAQKHGLRSAEFEAQVKILRQLLTMQRAYLCRYKQNKELARQALLAFTVIPAPARGSPALQHKT